MATQKPFSQSCENNKQPILRVIETVHTEPATVWEIGSGSGQRACYFPAQLPHLAWQPTDRGEHLPGIELWRAEAGPDNLHPQRPFRCRAETTRSAQRDQTLRKHRRARIPSRTGAISQPRNAGQ